MPSSTGTPQAVQWFALRVKSNRERVTSLALSGKGFDVFLPTYRSHEAERAKPLFPGYLFSRFDVRHRLPVLTVPGVVHIVGTGNNPIPVDEEELESVRIVVNSAVALRPCAAFSVGDLVRVVSGPLSGAQGSVTGITNQRLVVSITLLQRSLSVELNPGWITVASGLAGRSVSSSGLAASNLSSAVVL